KYNIFHLSPTFFWTFPHPSVNYGTASEFQKTEKQLSMFIDEESIRECLLRMIRRITPNLALRDDLLQEALIHLWLTEARRPAQTRSWYLQSCKFHLLHYLASGRSVDSAKRRGSQMHVMDDPDGREDLFEQADAGNSVL